MSHGREYLKQHVLGKGHTIYELSEAERATMLKLIEMGLVVKVGDHSRVKTVLRESVQFMEGCAASLKKHGHKISAEAMEAFVRDRVRTVL